MITVFTAGFGKVIKGGGDVLKLSTALYRKFTKDTKGLFRGSNHHQLRSIAYWEMIKSHNKNVQNLNDVEKAFKQYVDLSKIIFGVNDLFE